MREGRTAAFIDFDIAAGFEDRVALAGAGGDGDGAGAAIEGDRQKLPRLQRLDEGFGVFWSL